MAKKRNGRQDAIREIVRNKNVRAQRMLVDELKTFGFDCTQATVSRDIADMGLRKLPEGVYVLAEDLHLQRMVSELVVEVVRTGNLVLVKAQPGTASGIAAAIDAAELPAVLGSLAGNDTILVVARTDDDGERSRPLSRSSAILIDETFMMRQLCQVQVSHVSRTQRQLCLAQASHFIRERGARVSSPLLFWALCNETLVPGTTVSCGAR